jgi:hypothetical protein
VDALKSRVRKQASQPFRVGERERELENVSLLRKIAAEHIGKNAHMGTRSAVGLTHTAAQPPVRSTRRNSINPSAGSGKNCKPSWHVTASRIASMKGNAWPSATTGKNDGSPRRPRGGSDHRWRDVRANHNTGRADDGKRHERGLARSCGDIENPVAGQHLSSGDQRRRKEPRPTTKIAVICQSIDGPSRCRMEA